MTIHIFPLTEPPKKIDLATEYGSRLDGKLPTLESDYSRKMFLLATLHTWERRYASFLDRLDDEDFDPGQVTAFDFALTISEISVRLAKYEGARNA